MESAEQSGGGVPMVKPGDASVAAPFTSRIPSVRAVVDLIRQGKLGLMINTPLYTGSRHDEGAWRAAAITYRVPLITTLTGARAAVSALQAMRAGAWRVKPLQELFPNK
jgi:hypothetical protein